MRLASRGSGTGQARSLSLPLSLLPLSSLSHRRLSVLDSADTGRAAWPGPHWAGVAILTVAEGAVRQLRDIDLSVLPARVTARATQ